MDKMASLRQIFLDHGMLFGSTSSYMAGARAEDNIGGTAAFGDVHGDEVEEDDEAAQPGKQVQGSFFDVKLASKFRMSDFSSHIKLRKLIMPSTFRIWLPTAPSSTHSIYSSAEVSVCPAVILILV
jgi:hypothetical protein